MASENILYESEVFQDEYLVFGILVFDVLRNIAVRIDSVIVEV